MTAGRRTCTKPRFEPGESVEPRIVGWSEPMVARRTHDQPAAGIGDNDREPAAPASATALGTPADERWHHAKSEPRMLPLSIRPSGKGMPGDSRYLDRSCRLNARWIYTGVNALSTSHIRNRRCPRTAFLHRVTDRDYRMDSQFFCEEPSHGVERRFSKPSGGYDTPCEKHDFRIPSFWSIAVGI